MSAKSGVERGDACSHSLLLMNGFERTDGLSFTLLFELLPNVTDGDGTVASVKRDEGFSMLLLLPKTERC